MSGLQLSIHASPFPYALALLATHQGIPLTFTLEKTPEASYNDAPGSVADIQAELAARMESASVNGKEATMPELPAPLDANTPFPALPGIFNRLDDHLALRTFLAGPVRLGVADCITYGTLRSSVKALGVLKQGKHVHLARWYAHIDALPETIAVIKGLFDAKSTSTKAAKVEKNKAGTVDAELKGAVKGKVVVRFAPEPSGYLHIGHIKACVLNRFLADKYDGKMLLRFDDTNPEKEEDEFEGSFMSDLEMLGVKWEAVVHTSDHFEKIQELTRKLVAQGDAFMDDTEQQTMRDQRMALIPSKRRDESIEENLKRFDEMLSGSEEGQRWFLRAKMDYQSPNGAMRDPAIYRCINKPHHVTGDRYKAYPMYDLACPIVDALDGVTHALRANEYAARKPQYEWFLEKLGFAPIEIFDFGRLDFVYTLLSKRKLKYLVEKGYVGGWEDPRFPTIRGMRARGMTLEALKGFIASQGASSANLLMEWDQIWTWNKKIIDPIAPRYWAITEESHVPVTVTGFDAASETRRMPRHKKNPEVGDKDVVFSNRLLLEQLDASALTENEEVTLMDWGNAFVRSITRQGDKVTAVEMELHLAGDFKTTSKKIHWLAAPESGLKLVPVSLIDYDYLITKKKIEDGDDFTAVLNPQTEYRTKALADPNVTSLKQWEIIQFERKGFYIFKGTKDAEGRLEFGFVPDGRAPTVALKAKPFEESATAGPSSGEKGWGKATTKPKATKSADASAPADSTKPKARLGPTEVVQLPNSDSEDDAAAATAASGQDETPSAADPDMLKDFPDQTTELHLQHLKLDSDSLPALNFPRFGSNLERLCLRQNLLASPLPAEAFQGLDKLEELDFYDNRLGSRVHDEELAGCPNLHTLDLSFNGLRHPPRLPSQTKMHTLYLVQNKISHVDAQDLVWAKDTMKSLELGGNRLREIENIEMLKHLEELWLGKNKIRELKNLHNFASLKILSIQSNRITKMEGLDELVNLEQLYLSHNGLTRLEGLKRNLKLTTLDISNNQIAKIENVSHLKQLEEFWASYNQIPDLRDLDSQLAVLPNLETVYLEGNPCQRNDMVAYRRKVILALPQVKQVDATFVRA